MSKYNKHIVNKHVFIDAWWYTVCSSDCFPSHLEIFVSYVLWMTQMRWALRWRPSDHHHLPPCYPTLTLPQTNTLFAITDIKAHACNRLCQSRLHWILSGSLGCPPRRWILHQTTQPWRRAEVRWQHFVSYILGGNDDILKHLVTFTKIGCLLSVLN